MLEDNFDPMLFDNAMEVYDYNKLVARLREIKDVSKFIKSLSDQEYALWSKISSKKSKIRQ